MNSVGLRCFAARSLACGILMIFSRDATRAQAVTNPGLIYLQTIPVPGWKSTGSAGNANVDVFGFNPATRVLYLADRTNHAVDVIDTHINAVVGQIPLPSNTVPNVPLVAIDLQQLVLSDGAKSVLVYDLRAPEGAPDDYSLPSTTPDGMDYDPINQTVYVITDDPPYYLVGINLPQKKIVSQTKLPYSGDLIKFNPVDGKIYIATEDADNQNASAGVQIYDPATNSLGKPIIVGPACPGHGIDIDPIANIAIVGCFGGTGDKGDIAVDLTAGKVLTTFADEGGNGGGTDTIVFNPNTRHFYSGSGLNTATTSGCPQGFSASSTKRTPILGVSDVMGSGPNPARFDGAVCTGSGHVAGVDPITNFVYVPVSQYPTDPTSTSTGQNGVLVFWDSAQLAQAQVTSAKATLTSLGNAVSTNAVQMTLYGRRMHVTSFPTGISGHSAALVIPTTVGNEVVQCAVNPFTGIGGCGEDLIGDPLVGSVATLSVDGNAVARGPITR